jgi:ATP synthase protein I
MSGFGVAFRIGVELVAALIVGVGVGWLLDRWLGSKPWFLIVFFFLGAAAGILNVYRAASGIGLARAEGAPAPSNGEPEEDDDDGPAGAGPGRQ